MKRCAILQDTLNNRMYWLVETDEPEGTDIPAEQALREYGGQLVSPQGRIYDLPAELYDTRGWPGRDDGEPHPWETIYGRMKAERGEGISLAGMFHFRVLFSFQSQYIG